MNLAVKSAKFLLDAAVWEAQTELLELRLQVLLHLLPHIEEIPVSADLVAASERDVLEDVPAKNSARGHQYRTEVRALCLLALQDNIFVGEKRCSCRVLMAMGFPKSDFESSAQLFDTLVALLLELSSASTCSPAMLLPGEEEGVAEAAQTRERTREQPQQDELHKNSSSCSSSSSRGGGHSSSASRSSSAVDLAGDKKQENKSKKTRSPTPRSSRALAMARRGAIAQRDEEESTEDLVGKTLDHLLVGNLWLIYHALWKFTTSAFSSSYNNSNINYASSSTSLSTPCSGRPQSQTYERIKALVAKKLLVGFNRGAFSSAVFLETNGPQVLASFVASQNRRFGLAESLCVGILVRVMEENPSSIVPQILFQEKKSESVALSAAGPLCELVAAAPGRENATLDVGGDGAAPSRLQSLLGWLDSLCLKEQSDQHQEDPAEDEDDDDTSAYVARNALLWILGIPTLPQIRLYLVRLSAKVVIQRILEFFELALDCVEQVGKDDVAYGVIGMQVDIAGPPFGDVVDGDVEDGETLRQYDRDLSRAEVVMPFNYALAERGSGYNNRTSTTASAGDEDNSAASTGGMKWWPLLESCFVVLRTLLEHWDATSGIQRQKNINKNNNQGQEHEQQDDHLDNNVPDQLIALGFVDRLFELFEIPPELLTESLSAIAQECLKLLLKKNSDICLFSLNHFVDHFLQSEQHHLQASTTSSSAIGFLAAASASTSTVTTTTKKISGRAFFLELACSALEEADFFVDTNEFLHTPANKGTVEHFHAGGEKFRLAILRNLIEVFKKLNSSPALQTRLRRTFATLFEQASSCSLYLCVLQHYESEADQLQGKGGAFSSETTSNKATLPLLIEMEVLKAIARLSYWNPSKDSKTVHMLLPVLIDSIRESLTEEYVSLVLNAVLHLMLLDPTIEKATGSAVLSGCAAAFASNEMKRKSIESAEQGASDVVLLEGGLGLFEEEEAEEARRSEREEAVSFVMKVMQRFPTSDRVGTKAQYLLTAVLERGGSG
ncbi:unnamed protein product [Amoebophrya sp. A25]|nr:unnamed protein product [Amoebophrya sp. A25]|eukprot:GSA25T00000238001.1